MNNKKRMEYLDSIKSSLGIEFDGTIGDITISESYVTYIDIGNSATIRLNCKQIYHGHEGLTDFIKQVLDAWSNGYDIIFTDAEFVER